MEASPENPRKRMNRNLEEDLYSLNLRNRWISRDNMRCEMPGNRQDSESGASRSNASFSGVVKASDDWLLCYSGTVRKSWKTGPANQQRPWYWRINKGKNIQARKALNHGTQWNMGTQIGGGHVVFSNDNVFLRNLGEYWLWRGSHHFSWCRGHDTVELVQSCCCFAFLKHSRTGAAGSAGAPDRRAMDKLQQLEDAVA
nr:hypothetical protein Iba_chr13eCG11490 [Ipomoea batatas]